MKNHLRCDLIKDEIRGTDVKDFALPREQRRKKINKPRAIFKNFTSRPKNDISITD